MLSRVHLNNIFFFFYCGPCIAVTQKGYMLSVIHYHTRMLWYRQYCGNFRKISHKCLMVIYTVHYRPQYLVLSVVYGHTKCGFCRIKSHRFNGIYTVTQNVVWYLVSMILLLFCLSCFRLSPLSPDEL